jgi:hypothetical protein
MRYTGPTSHQRFESLLIGAALALLAGVGAGCGSEAPAPVAVARAGCTHEAFYWRENAAAWRHYELRMGATYYAQEEQMDILRTRPNGNGLISLSQQLIAAKLNVSAGAKDEGMERTFTAADALIGQLVVPPRGAGFRAPIDTVQITQELIAFNEGSVGPGACPTPRSEAVTPQP